MPQPQWIETELTRIEHRLIRDTGCTAEEAHALRRREQSLMIAGLCWGHDVRIMTEVLRLCGCLQLLPEHR